MFADVLQNKCFQIFRKIHRKTLALVCLFLKNVAGLRPATLLKKRHQNFGKIFKKTFFHSTYPHDCFCNKPFRPLFIQQPLVSLLITLNYFSNISQKILYHKWDKVFNNGPNKICRRQPLRNLKEYCLLKQTIILQLF